MAGFWRKFGEFILGKVRGSDIEHAKPYDTRRKLPTDAPRHVSRETPHDYIEKLTHLVSHQEAVRRVEAVMFDDTLGLDTRKEALNEYVELTGWYRPENNDAWSNEEWEKWAEIYESEPEVF